MKKLIAWVIVLIPIALLSYWGRSLYMFIDIPPHVGDGEFQNTSRREGPLVLNGYRIISKPIDLSKDHEEIMKLSRLPEIGVDCKLFFVIEDPDERFEAGGVQRFRLVHGEIALGLCDSRGTVIGNVDGGLCDLIWSGRAGRHALFGASLPLPNSFAPNSNETYTLSMSYKGDPQLAGMKGYASLECGGGK